MLISLTELHDLNLPKMHSYADAFWSIEVPRTEPNNDGRRYNACNRSSPLSSGAYQFERICAAGPSLQVLPAAHVVGSGMCLQYVSAMQSIQKRSARLVPT